MAALYAKYVAIPAPVTCGRGMIYVAKYNRVDAGNWKRCSRSRPVTWSEALTFAARKNAEEARLIAAKPPILHGLTA